MNETAHILQGVISRYEQHHGLRDVLNAEAGRLDVCRDVVSVLCEISEWIEEDPLIIPVAQEGHAQTLVRAGNLFGICDRAMYEDQDITDIENKVKIYYMNKPWKLTSNYVADLIYVRQNMMVFHKMLPVNLRRPFLF